MLARGRVDRPSANQLSGLALLSAGSGRYTFGVAGLGPGGEASYGERRRHPWQRALSSDSADMSRHFANEPRPDRHSLPNRWSGPPLPL